MHCFGAWSDTKTNVTRKCNVSEQIRWIFTVLLEPEEFGHKRTEKVPNTLLRLVFRVERVSEVENSLTKVSVVENALFRRKFGVTRKLQENALFRSKYIGFLQSFWNQKNLQYKCRFAPILTNKTTL